MLCIFTGEESEQCSKSYLWPVISEVLDSRLNVAQIQRIYFTCPSEKETLDTFEKRSTVFKKNLGMDDGNSTRLLARLTAPW